MPKFDVHMTVALTYGVHGNDSDDASQRVQRIVGHTLSQLEGVVLLIMDVGEVAHVATADPVPRARLQPRRYGRPVG